MSYQRERKFKAAYAAIPAAQRADMEKEREALAHGSVNSLMECPHCKTRGQIRTRPIRMKKAVTGGKPWLLL